MKLSRRQKRGSGSRWASGQKIPPLPVFQAQKVGAAPKLTFNLPKCRPFTIDLGFLKKRPALQDLFTKAFWIIFAPNKSESSIRANHMDLKYFGEFLDWYSNEGTNIVRALDLTPDGLHDFSVWLTATRGKKRPAARSTYLRIAGFLMKTKVLFPNEFSPVFQAPTNRYPGAFYERVSVQALPLDQFRQVMQVAAEKIDAIRAGYRDGDYPKSVQDLVPFMLIIAARTGMNPESLYTLNRDCLQPHLLDSDCYYISWDKLRAGSPQRQPHRRDRLRRLGAVELIEFLLTFTQPLVCDVDGRDRNRLLLVSSTRGPSSLHRHAIGYALHEFIRKNDLPSFTFAQMRPTAATALYVDSGGNLRRVQLFLQHRSISTTIRYISEVITRPFHQRAIREAQEKMVVHITVIPKTRARGAAKLGLSREAQTKIVAGKWDTGCATCRNPYSSPQPGEVEGRLCKALHACWTCPNALWFVEDLPSVLRTRERFLRLRQDMRASDWSALYGTVVVIIDHDILPYFTESQVAEARRIISNSRE